MCFGFSQITLLLPLRLMILHFSQIGLTGAEIKVPLFIDIGDKITIDTRTGEYLSRCKA